MSDRDRERRNWRDIDKMRDSSQNGRGRRQGSSRDTDLSGPAQKSYRAQLERAFQSGKLAELAEALGQKSPRPEPEKTGAAEKGSQSANDVHEQRPSLPPAPRDLPKNPVRESKKKLLGKLEAAEGREAISKATEAYLSKFDRLPDDYEILTKALLHKHDGRVLGFLEQLQGMIPKERPRRARGLQAQLRYLEETHSDPEVRAQAAQVRAML